MQQKKTKSTNEASYDGTVAWAGRLERPLLDALKPFAKRGRRTIAAQINLVIEEWITLQGTGGVQHFSQALPGLPPSIGGTPPKVPKAFQKPAPPPAPKSAIAEIAESEEGWEGSDPSTLLAGTKVKI